MQSERLRWLGRLARLAERWKVVIAEGVHGNAYRELLRRARVVFNRSIRGECNKRTFEAVAAGSLLLSERGNREVSCYLADGKEYVSYGDDLEEVLEHYLSHEEERRAIAEAARVRAPEFAFEALWQPLLAEIEGDLAELRRRAADRPRPQGERALLARLWQALGDTDGGDLTLVSDLNAALARYGRSAALHNALGLALTLQGHGGGPTTDVLAQQAATQFRRALDCDGRHAVAALNLAEALAGAGQQRAAPDVLRLALDALELAPVAALDLEAGHFPPGFDTFRVEWERAAWDHPGDPSGEARAKQDLLCWRLYALRAGLTGNPTDYFEACAARPDLPLARAALGCALGRARQAHAAARHLRRAVEDNPFDAEVARSLFQALTDAGDVAEARRLARDRRLLLAAAPGRLRAEEWFLKAPPPGDELASLIILCCNEVHVTRLCLESVLRHTRPPYELILVDNGSQDSTPEYLQEIARRVGTPPPNPLPEAERVGQNFFLPLSASGRGPGGGVPVRIEIIRNEENVGFPRGCNQGLRAAHGRYLVLLNNDTVVTPGWLDRLVAWSLHEWPKIGLVGPVSNCAPPPQHIAAAGNDRLDGLDAFALRRRQEYAGKALRVDRLTGFCLLLHREVLEKVGFLDERFGYGFFEDDDLCLRARAAGFQLLVALDTFIHHFGSRTFEGLKLDARQALRDNFARFQAKWGAERTRGYSLPGDPQAPTPARTAAELFGPYRGRKSLTMIVKNEENNLADCLRSAADLFDEVIIVDTGSIDRTKEIALSFGPTVKVFDFPWCDNFAAARNEALRHATGDWIFWMDADDRLDDENREKLRVLLAGLGNDNAAYSMKCVCLPDPVTRSTTVVDHVRLFRRHDLLRWEYRVHEQILPTAKALGAELRWADVAVHHTGYQDPALRQKKLRRDLRLLELELAEHPEAAFPLFNLGSILMELGRHAEALDALRRSLTRSAPTDSIVRKLYALIAGCHLGLGQKLEALAVCREGLGHCPDDAELLFRQAKILSDLGNWPEAEAVLLHLLSTRAGQHFASVEGGLRGHLGRHNLAVVYHRQGKHDLAAAQWRLVVQERPEFLPGWLGLGESALARGDSAGLEEAARQAEALPGGPVEADLLRLRGLLARQEIVAAREMGQRLAGEYPKDVGPRLLWADALRSGTPDLEAALAVLREALLIAPDNPVVQQALSGLLRQKTRTDTAAFEARGDLAAWALGERYRAACATPSEINEHLPTLCELARECKHVTELGTRTGVSTLALLWAQPGKLVCYDLVRYPEVDQLQALAGQTEFVFRQEDVLQADIEETDLLFLDSFHAYEQLKEELRRHAAKARRYIVLHDTTSFGERGEADGQQGLWPAVEEFLAEGSFKLKQRFTNNNGLTILERTEATGANLERRES